MTVKQLILILARLPSEMEVKVLDDLMLYYPSPIREIWVDEEECLIHHRHTIHGMNEKIIWSSPETINVQSSTIPDNVGELKLISPNPGTTSK